MPKRQREGRNFHDEGNGGDDVIEDNGAAIDFSALTPGKAVRFPSYLERYSTKRFRSDSSEEIHDQWVCQHSNKLCIVGVCPSHALFLDPEDAIVDIDWTGPSGTDKQNVKVTGKGKKGGAFVQPDSILCCVKTKKGKEYKLRACVRGSLIEVNPRLVGESGCKLLTEHMNSEGYLAIISPPRDDSSEKTLSGLLTPEEFKKKRRISDDELFADPK